jgi:replicative DNA helicase
VYTVVQVEHAFERGEPAVTVAELPDRRDDRAQVSGYDRTPPQDVAAEQSVLGGMLLSKDAIADVVEVLRGHDMYRPAHETIYEAILDLYGRGEPADPVTVAAELQKQGDLGRVGGAPYLHTLVSSVPTAANAGYYAQIVRERAVLRRLVEAGTRIVQMGYGGDGEVDDIVDRAQAEVYGVTDRRTSEDYLPLGDIMEGTLDEIEAIGSRGGEMVGVPTGFADLDALTNGLHPGQMIVLAARPAIGKALALDTPLPTPTGWTTMGEVRVGDELFGADGKPTRVVAATEVMLQRPCYKVEFSDGSVIVADGQHQWVTSTRAQRRALGERRLPSYYWPAESIDRLRDAASRGGADRLVSRSEVLTEIGREFLAAFNIVARQLVTKGKAPRRASGPKRTYMRSCPVYSRREVLAALLARVTTPVGSAQAADLGDSVRTTEEIAASLYHDSAERRRNHAIRVAKPLDLPPRSLPLDPYTLGAWLGDGHSHAARITTADPEILGRIEQAGIISDRQGQTITYSLMKPSAVVDAEPRNCVVCGREFKPATTQVRTCGRSCGGKSRDVPGEHPAPSCRRCGGPATTGFGWCSACVKSHGSVQGVLRRIGVLGNKHIPTEYLRASEAQRRDLLAGLLDTDGHCTPSGIVQFAVTNERLARDTLELILSLGYKSTLSAKPCKGRTETSSTAWTVTFTPGDKVFGLTRKNIRIKASGARTRTRYITRVDRVDSVPVRCVQVDDVDHLYLAGPSMVPTHNSTLGLDLARAAAIRHQLTTVMFSLEMSRNEITMRLLSAEARVPLHHMRTGSMTDDDWNRIARRTGEVSSAPLFLDDSPNMTMMEIRAKCRRLKQRHDLRLVIVDYLQLMTSGKRVESRQQEVAEFSRALKLLAKELDVPVVAISQLNRSAEQRQDKKPMLADLRESGSIEQDSDMVILLHREDAYEKESPRAGEADFIVAKHRNGPTATITVAFQGHYSRFVDMAQ